MVDLLRLEVLRQWTEDDVYQVVRESFSKDQRRFELAEDTETKAVWIRATHKHSVQKAQPPPPTGPPPSNGHVLPPPPNETPPVKAFSMATPPMTPVTSPRCMKEDKASVTPEKLDRSVETPCNAAGPAPDEVVAPSLVDTAHWQRFLSDSASTPAEEASCWWWCCLDDDCFLEDAPAPWQKFIDSQTGRQFWHKDDHKWFFVDTGHKL